MGVIKQVPRRAYTNVMEVMVAEEVEQQILQLPPRVARYIKPVEVETYALNRLPSLYASSERGWQSQYSKASRTLRKQVADAVRQAIAAVQVDPLRTAEPLEIPQAEDAAKLLTKFRRLLGQPDLTWEAMLKQLKAGGQLGSTASPGTPADADASSHSVHRPGTYGGEHGWRSKRSSGAAAAHHNRSNYDWGDSRYR